MCGPAQRRSWRARYSSAVLFVFFAFFAFGSASGVAAAQAPTFELDSDGVLSLIALPEVLSRREVRSHLDSGLTTSFVVVGKIRDDAGREVRGAGKVEIRYELWDEVYLVRITGIGGARRLVSARTFEELQGIWRGLRLPLARVRSLARSAAPWRVALNLSVVPFSQSEQREAQRWFSDSIAARAPAAPSPPSPDPREPASSASGGVLDLFLGTSIQRRSLVRYDWTVTFHPEERR